MSDLLPGPGAAYICRCEELDAEAVRAAIAAGACTINDVKRRTRAGMGLCQGAYCLEHVAQMMREAGVAPQPSTPMTARPPARMLTVGELAATRTGGG
jgi:bacterioferritin-associated ferredoxin